MIKKILIIFLGILLFSIFIICIKSYREQKYFSQEQEKIAKILGTQIENFPPSQHFPYGYFDKKLKKGMSLSEVHSIMKGYVSVYRCSDLLENYYFISENDNNTLEFSIIYDEDKLFSELISEERGYHFLSPECIPGQVN